MRSTPVIFMTLTLFAAAACPVLGQSGNFGLAGAVSGRDLLVGQPANWYGPGVIYVYRADAVGRWREAARLLAPDSVRGDDFGRSLATDGPRLLVGAPNKLDGAGAVYLFTRQGGQNGAWSYVASRPGDGGGFGTAIAIEGADVFVGAPGADRSGLVYQLTTGGLERQAALRSGSLSEGSQFGAALSLEGDLLVVGAPRADSGAGAAVLYRRQPGGAWREEAMLSVERVPGQPPSRAGTAVLLAGGRAFVAAPNQGGGVGAVLIYDRDSSSGEWRRSDQLLPFDGARGSGFGVALAAGGSEVWVGAPNAGDRDGAVYRFATDGSGGWTGVEALRADSAGPDAWPFWFGASMAIGDGVAVVGMPQRDFGEGRAVLLTEQNGAWRAGRTVMGEIFTIGAPAGQQLECTDGKLAGFDCSNVELVSFMPVATLGGARGVWVNDVWGWSDPETGRDFALVSRRDGASFVDVTEPERPRLVGTLPRTAGSPPSVWRDIKVYRNHAFVVSDGAGAHGMQVFDLTRLRSVPGGEPVVFTEDAHYDRMHSAHNVVADTTSGFLFIVGSNGGGETCGGGLHMVDAREPTRPTFAGCYSDKGSGRTRAYTHDAQCVTYLGPDERYRGREICVGSNESEINIADVTDKSRPVPIGRSSYPNVAYAHQGWFDKDQRYFYMGDEGDEISGLVSGTRTIVWDLSRLDDPIVAREYIGPVAATDHNLFVKDDRVYMSNYGSGLRVLDISDRANPREVAFFDSSPVGRNEPGTSSRASGAWSNYPFFESGVVVFTSVREGLFIVRVKPARLVP